MMPKNRFTFVLITLVSLMCYSQSPEDSGKPINWIESLENGDSYDIEITSLGCFGGSRQNVTLLKKADHISAQLQEKTIQLTDTDYQTIVNFENELRSLQMGGCTTIDTYVIRFRGQKFQTSDGTCSWHGYRKIVALFE
jgi:hypothetical protein